MTVERMTEAHLSDVAALERETFSEPWSREALQFLLTDGALGFVCVEDGRAVAYGGMVIAPFEGQVTNVAVRSDYRRRGLGRRLVEAMVAEARRLGLEQIALEVRVSNEAAIGLYEGLGFVRAGVRKRFYKDPTEDAYVMLLSVE